jgi:hypothetical protein
MHHRALDAALLLDSDLLAAGWPACERYPGEPVGSIAANSMRRSFLKKFHNFKANPSGDKAALDLFLSFNEKCSNWVKPQFGSDAEAVAYGEARDLFYEIWYPQSGGDRIPTLASVSRHFDVGNGSNIGAKFTDFYSKFATSKLSATSPVLHDWYRRAISGSETWRDVEVFRAKYAGTEIVSGSRLGFVPKTPEITRVICVEPVLNMIFQKGLAGLLTERLESRFGLSLETQPDRNAELARIGSLTGRFATIDLSSASDSISLRFVRDFVPAELLHWLEVSRCSKTTLPDGREVTQHMISSMGNAFTFPLQTMIFTCLLLGCYRACGIQACRIGGSNDNWGVFGDDIVCDTRVYRLLCRILAHAGFVVNKDKSFDSGPFRESCGRDYHLGHNVRGVYLKSLRDVCDYYSIVNRLNRWSAKHLMPLPKSVRFFAKRVPFRGVPFDEQDDSGIKVPLCLLKFVKRDQFDSVHYVRTFAKETSVKVTGEKSVAGSPISVISPSGILLAATAGRLRDGLISIRQYERKVVTQRARTPRWDYVPRDQYENAGEQLLSCTRANLVN